ncbi:MAG: PhnD/SsuA/transferrin family substrate-binding protein, partial [Thermodesulfobacteriota bacterium]
KSQFDGGAVKDIIAYKYQREGLRIIFFTEPIPTVPIIVNKKAFPEIIQSVKSSLLNLDPENPIHQRKMSQWDEEFKYGFTEAFDSDYDFIRQIFRALKKEYGERRHIRE